MPWEGKSTNAKKTKAPAGSRLTKKKPAKQQEEYPGNTPNDKGVDSSNFKTRYSVIALRAHTLKKDYHTHLEKALEDIRLIIAGVVDATGLPYKDVEDDIMATHSAQVRTRAICGWNVYSAECLNICNKGTYLTCLNCCSFHPSIR